MTIHGTHGDDNLVGTTGNDTFNLTGGGNDTAFGDAGNDTFWMGATLTAADRIDGGTGIDTVTLNGNYSAGLVFDADTIVNVEKLFLHKGHDYNLTMNDGNVAAGKVLTIGAASLGAGDTLTFDGSAELDGRFIVLAGAGDDVITGGAKADRIDLSRGGNDTVHGGGGTDVIILGGTFTSADKIDGGTGNDTVILAGMGDDAVFFTADTMVGIENLKLGAGHSYALRTDDATVASGATMTVDGSALTGTDTFAFTGSAETDGAFHFIGGGSNTIELTGGGGNDIFDMTAIQAFADTGLAGGGGNDTFSFLGNFDSSSQTIDGGTGFNTLSLDGDYSAISLVGSGIIDNIQTVTFAGGHSYTGIRVFDDVAGGGTLTFDATALQSGDGFGLDASLSSNAIDLLAGDGTYTVTGSVQNDTFEMGATFTASDAIDGGDGTDTVTIDGDYAGANALVFTATTMTNVENLVLGGGHSYDITTDDATVANGTLFVVGGDFTIDGSALGVGDVLTVDASAETGAESFTIIGGAGDDVITGPSGGNGIVFDLSHGGDDTATGANATFAMGGALTAADQLDGVASSTFSEVELDGDYSSGLVFADTTITNMNQIVLAGGHSYNLTTADGNVAAGHDLTIGGFALGTGESLTFDGSAETDGGFFIAGGAGDDVLTGGSGYNGGTASHLANVANQFDLSAGGEDTAHGGAASDVFEIGGAFDSGDAIDGGGGTDEVVLEGDYTGANALVFGATTMLNVEFLQIDASNSYDLTTNDATVASGQTLTVDASVLLASDTLTFDGSAETDGSFAFTGGAGNDVLTGGQWGDSYDLSFGGNDTVHAGSGFNTIYMGGALTAADTIDGGSGLNSIELDGDYTGANAVVFGAATMTNVQELFVDAGHSYDLTTNDATVGVGGIMLVDGSALDATDSLHFDGSAELDGAFFINDGLGNDVLIGGAGGDLLSFDGGGTDKGVGGGGDDLIDACGHLDATDQFDGGSGNDAMELTASETASGNYTGADALHLTASMMANFENLLLDGGGSYDITTVDATVAAGVDFFVDASFLAPGESLTFDGSAETDGTFDILDGEGDDVLTGGAGADTFDIGGGGNDVVHGNGGADLILAWDMLTAADKIDGGSGSDTLELTGDYSAGLTLNADTVTNIETLLLDSGNSYNLTTADGTIANGETLTVDASQLDPSTYLILDGSAETDGHFAFTGGAGDDTLTGGGQSDTFDLTLGGNDTANGDAGDDTFSFGGTFTAADTVDGGTGANTIDLGAGTTATMSSAAVTNIQTVGMATNEAYNLTVTGDIAGGARLKFDAGDTYDVKTIDVSGATSAGYDFVGGTGAMNVKFGANFSLSDTFTLGGGFGQFGLELHGDYSGGNALTFDAGTISDLTNFKVDDGFDYDITLNAANVSNALGTFTFDAQGITNHNVTFDMSTANADAFFHGGAGNTGVDNVHTGSGNDALFGGAGDDILNAGTGNATIDGYLGQDTITVDASGTQLFQFAHANESSGSSYDIIHGLNFDNADFEIGLGAGVTTIDGAITTGTLSAASFDTDLANAVSSLGNHHAVLFTASAGDLSGHTFLVVEQNGGTGYVSGFDVVIDVTGYSGTLTTGDFI